MITYTGIVTLMFMYLPWGIKAQYPDNEMRFYEESANRVADTRTAAGTPARMRPLEEFVARARSDWRGGDVGTVAVSLPNDAHAAVGVTQRADDLSNDAPSILYDAVSGQRLQYSGAPGGASQTRGVMVGLHIAHFAGGWMRALFFGSGLLGCLMVASGVVMWAVKERPKHAKAGRIGFGLRLVDALNIGTVAGLPIAFAAFFWANRLVPVALEARAAMEAHLFFAAWGGALLAAFVWPRRAMWSWQLYLGAGLFALVPLLNALTTDLHLGVTVPAGQWALAGVDLVCLGLGVCLGIAGWRLQHWKAPQSAAARKARAQATPAPQNALPVQEGA